MMLTRQSAPINILVIDDTPDNLRLISKIIESEGYIVRKALNGRMALQSAQRNPPDLILLDINMPEMNGYEVCQQLKASKITAHIPIIFISALAQINDKVKAFDLGGQDYITKPFQELEVLIRIKNQLLIQQQQKHLLDQQQLLAQKNHQLEQEVQERQRAEMEVRRLNSDLEQRVEIRTSELQQSLNFEATLKRISDKVRDSLDQHQILETAVKELATALAVYCCDAVLYSPDHKLSIIRYQYVPSGSNPSQGQLLYLYDAPEIYRQLQDQRSNLAFCQIEPTSIGNNSSILACPVFDEQVEQLGILGDLWLFKDKGDYFSDMEIHLVQQVANQCAIALRQARLYEAAQQQVQELARLNQLKDDFLSTISHELRTPIANMKMALKLLLNMVERGKNSDPENYNLALLNDKAAQYLGILQSECERELSLIEDLLNLQHLEAGVYLLKNSTIRLDHWIYHILEGFEMRMKTQKQTLSVELPNQTTSITTDISSLNRILIELLTNACKYTPAGETITVKAVLETDQLELHISNTGVTIPPAELERIFDKFYRIPNHDPWQHDGTGLGLAIVKKMIEYMGGNIIAKSANNVTEFIVSCPLATDAND